MRACVRLWCDGEGEALVVFLEGTSVGRRERIVDGFLEGVAVRYLVGFADEALFGERVGDFDGIGNVTDKGRWDDTLEGDNEPEYVGEGEVGFIVGGIMELLTKVISTIFVDVFSPIMISSCERKMVLFLFEDDIFVVVEWTSFR